MPDNNDKRARIQHHIDSACFWLLDDDLATPINLNDVDNETCRDFLASAYNNISAAIDLLDHDRQPVDGSPPDAADPA